jgi:hypothetical protein
MQIGPNGAVRNAQGVLPHGVSPVNYLSVNNARVLFNFGTALTQKVKVAMYTPSLTDKSYGQSLLVNYG